MAINIRSDEQFVVRLTGEQLALIVQGLGELQHKVAAPVEQHLHAEVLRCKELAETKVSSTAATVVDPLKTYFEAMPYIEAVK